MIDQQEEDRIYDFVKRGNYHAALNLSLSAMNEHRRKHEQDGVDHFIAVMKKILDKIDHEFGSAQT